MNIFTIKSILGHTRRPDITFHSSGKIDITSRIVNSLGINQGDVIDIMTANGEFYLYVSVRAADICGRHEAQCYPSKRGGRHFRTYCRRLCYAILSQHPAHISDLSHDNRPFRLSFAAGEVIELNGHKAITIITRNIICHD